MLDKILEDLFKASNRFIGFKGLHQFKAKYEPDWDPRYVWYQGGLLRLPQIGLAVYELLKAPSKNTPSRGTS
jgi:phosphatidylglycerol lysyltransferase